LTGSRIAPSSSKGRAKRSTLHRSLCPAAQTIVPPVVSPPLPRRVESQCLQMSRPWCEVKSRRGARHPCEHRGLCLSQPPMSLLWDYRRSHSCVGWRWQAWPSRADSDVPLSGLPHHVQCSTPHPLIPSENSLSCPVAVVRITRWQKGWTHPRLHESSATARPPSRAFLTRAARARSAHGRALLQQPAPPTSPVGRTAHESAEFSASPVAVVGHRSSHPRFFRCFSSVPAPNTWHTCSSTLSERA
jgi:hypothetical protein